ncbi:MAG: hypothetical protein ACPIOQ_36390, partial [Promethearchaeia archaeon]
DRARIIVTEVSIASLRRQGSPTHGQNSAAGGRTRGGKCHCASVNGSRAPHVGVPAATYGD